MIFRRIWSCWPSKFVKIHQKHMTKKWIELKFLIIVWLDPTHAVRGMRQYCVCSDKSRNREHTAQRSWKCMVKLIGTSKKKNMINHIVECRVSIERTAKHINRHTLARARAHCRMNATKSFTLNTLTLCIPRVYEWEKLLSKWMNVPWIGASRTECVSLLIWSSRKQKINVGEVQ